MVTEKHTGSQVCTLSFSKHQNELISTHGFSQNEVALWKTPNLRKIISLGGHSQRVLYQAQSPCGNYVVTGAGDETLRFWDLNYPQVDAENRGPSGLNVRRRPKKSKSSKSQASKLEIPVLR